MTFAKEIRGAERSYLDRELIRCDRAIRNPKAKPFTVAWFQASKRVDRGRDTARRIAGAGVAATIMISRR